MANIPRTIPVSSAKKRKLSHLSQEDDPQDSIPLLPSAKAVFVLRQLRRLDTLLEQEVELLRKIRYKQKNQHKAATWWRHLGGTQRVAKRFHEDFKRYILPRLPEIQTAASVQSASAAAPAKPALKTEEVQTVVESSLRLLLLAEHASPINIKTMAALEQLLKAALFMPLAMTLKALVARLESSIALAAEELDSLLVLIASSVPTTTKDGLTDNLRSQPRDLTKLWTRASAAHSIPPTPVPSIPHSEQPSRLGTPLLQLEPPASVAELVEDASTIPRKRKSKLQTVETAQRALVPDPKLPEGLDAYGTDDNNEAAAGMQVDTADIGGSLQKKEKRAKKVNSTQASREGSRATQLPLVLAEASEAKASQVPADVLSTVPAAAEPSETTKLSEQPKKLKVLKKKKAKKTAGDGDDIDAIFAGM